MKIWGFSYKMCVIKIDGVLLHVNWVGNMKMVWTFNFFFFFHKKVEKRNFVRNMSWPYEDEGNINFWMYMCVGTMKMVETLIFVCTYGLAIWKWSEPLLKGKFSYWNVINVRACVVLKAQLCVFSYSWWKATFALNNWNSIYFWTSFIFKLSETCVVVVWVVWWLFKKKKK